MHYPPCITRQSAFINTLSRVPFSGPLYFLCMQQKSPNYNFIDSLAPLIPGRASLLITYIRSCALRKATTEMITSWHWLLLKLKQLYNDKKNGRSFSRLAASTFDYNFLARNRNDDPAGIRWIKSDLIGFTYKWRINKSRNRHNVGRFFEGVLYFGRPLNHLDKEAGMKTKKKIKTKCARAKEKCKGHSVGPHLSWRCLWNIFEVQGQIMLAYFCAK